jgi:hypothetical protein
VNLIVIAPALLLTITGVIDIPLALAQGATDQPYSTEQPDSASTPVYKPRVIGAPEGRVGGASRSASIPATALPRIELLAPADHAGLTANSQPTLYFFVSRPVQWPMQFTIRAPLQPIPVVRVTIPSPPTAGTYPISLASYGVHLQPGVVYTWSVSIVMQPGAGSRNIVASAPIILDPGSPISAPARDPGRLAAYFAERGLWYDAITAAAEAQRHGNNSVIAALLQQGRASIRTDDAPYANARAQ